MVHGSLRAIKAGIKGFAEDMMEFVHTRLLLHPLDHVPDPQILRIPGRLLRHCKHTALPHEPLLVLLADDLGAEFLVHFLLFHDSEDGIGLAYDAR